MSEIIFQTSIMGFKVTVFTNRIEYKEWLTKRVIPISEIASIEVAMIGVQEIILETTGGRKYKILVRLRDKNQLVEAINKARYGE